MSTQWTSPQAYCRLRLFDPMACDRDELPSWVKIAQELGLTPPANGTKSPSFGVTPPSYSPHWSIFPASWVMPSLSSAISGVQSRLQVA